MSAVRKGALIWNVDEKWHALCASVAVCAEVHWKCFVNRQNQPFSMHSQLISTSFRAVCPSPTRHFHFTFQMFANDSFHFDCGFIVHFNFFLQRCTFVHSIKFWPWLFQMLWIYCMHWFQKMESGTTGKTSVRYSW